LEGYSAYDAVNRYGKGMAHGFINATPKQVMAWLADGRGDGILTVDVVEKTYTTSTEILPIPITIPTISDRETLYRAAYIRNEADNSFTRVGYEARAIDIGFEASLTIS
jgi:hypothetical protein